MKKFFVCAVLLLAGCSVIKYVPVKETEYVTVREVETVRDTVVRVELEKARLSDFVDVGDTLVLQTDLARSKAFIDTTANVLRGEIENTKPYVEKEIPVKEKVVYRDSLVYKEVPVEVEKLVEKKYVPFWWKFFGVIGILFLAVRFCLFVLRDVKKI